MIKNYYASKGTSSLLEEGLRLIRDIDHKDRLITDVVGDAESGVKG
jgi:hypothetical protein